MALNISFLWLWSFVVDNALADIPEWNFSQSYWIKGWTGFMIYIRRNWKNRGFVCVSRYITYFWIKLYEYTFGIIEMLYNWNNHIEKPQFQYNFCLNWKNILLLRNEKRVLEIIIHHKWNNDKMNNDAKIKWNQMFNIISTRASTCCNKIAIELLISRICYGVMKILNIIIYFSLSIVFFFFYNFHY